MKPRRKKFRSLVRNLVKEVLSEDPHRVTKDGKKMSMYWGEIGKVEAYGFGFGSSGEAYIGMDGQDHNSFWRTPPGSDYEGYKDPPDGRFDFDYPGRIFLEPKIISFWTYPSRTKFYPLLKKLENEWKDRFPDKKPLDFSSGNWEVEVWDKDNDIGKTKEFMPIGDYQKPSERGEGRTHSSALTSNVNEVSRKNLRKMIFEVLRAEGLI